MIYYVLPGIGMYGGIKKAFQCADILNDCNIVTTVATPGGESPGWFATRSPVINRADLDVRCEASDTVLFSWPPDADFVAGLAAETKVVHMQGANTRADEVLMDHSGEFHFISHGLHMSLKLLEHGLIAPYVPNSISPIFRYSEEPKIRNSLAYMPRKGGERIVKELKNNLTWSLQWREIHNLTEEQVAKILKTSDIFLAISAREAFGLPPLEAMSAMCCVVGYPGDGGLEFMHHGETAHVVANNDLEALLQALDFVITHPQYRDSLRLGGFEYSAYYTREREQNHLLRALELLQL
ncbi:MAG TPA: glycosyltransferase [Gammaproteobacteria bacterium]|nr:glycosyltransferase [Gammaproteobacteria bacterium]